MIRGVWHQMGDRSQNLVLEQLKLGNGVGVIISPRDLAIKHAIQRSTEYHKLGAHVLIDQQFYLPGATLGKLKTYSISKYRNSVSKLNALNNQQLTELRKELTKIHKDIAADGVIAPAVVYEAGRTDIMKLNSMLFDVASDVAKELKIPVYATVVIGNSATTSDDVLNTVISAATTLEADGWYFSYEFNDERITTSKEHVQRCCATGLALACTGKPVLHAYAGPMGLLSFGFGATAIAIGHSQNLWRFTRERFDPSKSKKGGGGKSPARYFSVPLWGTIINPDEVVQLSSKMRTDALTTSQFMKPPSKWNANKHLLFVLGSALGNLAKDLDVRKNAKTAIDILNNAVTLHKQIKSAGISLKDNTNSYQLSWQKAMSDVLKNSSSDYDYLELLS